MNFGHVVIKKDGEKCTCGNRGCFERYASMRTLKGKLALIDGVDSINSNRLREILEKPSPNAKKVIEEFISDLNIGLTNLINIFEPDAICIGGSFVYFGDILLNMLKQEMQDKNLSFSGSMPRLLLAKMGNDAGMIGSTLLQI